MNSSLFTAIVLAGGAGTRLNSVVSDRPKPMAEVAGRPFLEHLLRYWKNQGVRRFVFSVGYLYEWIQDHFGRSFDGCRIDYVIESQPLGTGGGLLLCQRTLHLTDPFLLLNGDTFFPVELNALHNEAERHDADWVFSLFPTNYDHRYLLAEFTDAGLLSFKSSKKNNHGQLSHWANGGVYWVNPRALIPFQNDTTKISLETELFTKCEQLGQIFSGVQNQVPFVDIGTPLDYARAQTMTCFT